MIRIEVFSFGHFKTIWWLEMVSSHNVVDIVDSSCSKSDFGEISRPYASIGIFCLILRKVRSIDVIVYITVLISLYRSLSSHS